MRFLHLFSKNQGVFMGDTVHGSVKWFDPKKGYGFIERKEGEDLFCHFSVINIDGFKTLNNGQLVTFEVEKNDKGERAINVQLA